MILISSGEYISQELAIEFGNIPPSFMPVKNKRLFIHQIELFKDSERDVYISLPIDYDIPIEDERLYNLKIIRVPRGLTLSKSIKYCVEYIKEEDNLTILHGDTLFNKVDLTKNTASVNISNFDYKWGFLNNRDEIYSGLFNVGKEKLNYFLNLLEEEKEFLDAINKFHFSPIYNLDWYDFGHVNTYYNSITKLLEARQDNNFICNGREITKYSNNTYKILGEIEWFKKFQRTIYTPKLISSLEVIDNKVSYTLEYHTLPLLSNIYVFGNKPINIWNSILLSCKEFLDYLSQYKLDKTENFKSLYLQKTKERLNDFSISTGININSAIVWDEQKLLPSISEIMYKSYRNINPSHISTAIHGDFHFGNIFYNFKNSLIKVIDPRGLDSKNNITIYGDPRYDIAKLCHSILGGYDFIISGYQHGEITKSTDSRIYFSPFFLKTNQKLTELFFTIFCEYDRTEIISITILLFLSMLPLHSDNYDRQISMLSTAVYLYLEYLH